MTAITAAFKAEFSDDVKQAFQQKGSKLRNAVRTVTGVNASTYTFRTLAALTANTKARNADVTGLTVNHGTAVATLADLYAPVYLDKLDMEKAGQIPDMRKEYAVAAANAVGRGLDDAIVTAIAASNTNTATATGGLTLAKLVECVQGLNSIDSDEIDRYLVIGAKQVSDALQIQQLTSADYVAIQNIMNSGIGKALGFTWIMSNRLPLATANRSTFAFNKSAVGLAIGQDITTPIDWIPEKVSYLVNSYISAGAVVIEATGVQEMICVE